MEIDGTGSDRLNATGVVTLNGATLSLSLLGGYVHTTGTVYTIVAGNPVVGTFSGLPEGATVTASGKTFRISYVGSVTLTATGATHLSISAPASATAGTAFSFTVTALDQFNSVATGYTGTVHFTSSDGQAVLPANSTLTNGTGTFSATLKTAGSQTITGTDAEHVGLPAARDAAGDAGPAGHSRAPDLLATEGPRFYNSCVPMDIAAQRAWMQQWRKAAPALEEQRRRELRLLSDDDALAASEAVLSLALLTPITRARLTDSGLVSQQRLFHRRTR